MIRRLAGDTFVLVLEDCHWMDSASWRLAERVANDFPSALLILTSRPCPDSIEIEGLRRLEHFVELALQPLDDGAIKGIVTSILADIDVPAHVIEEVVARSSGNPFFAREYSLLLDSNRDFEQPNEVARGVGSSSFEADGKTEPLTVQGLVASRLDALAPDASVAVKVASVLGTRFDPSVFAAVVSGKLQGSDLNAVYAALDRQPPHRAHLLPPADIGPPKVLPGASRMRGAAAR